jgi:hypothetical protein
MTRTRRQFSEFIVIRKRNMRSSKRFKALMVACAIAVPTTLAFADPLNPATAAPAPAAPATAALATTNACSNPVLATDLNGWGSLNGSWVTRDTVGDLAGVSWAFDTGGPSFYMPQLSVTAGQTWTFSARDRVVYGSGSAAIAVDWYNSGGSYLGEQAAPAVTLPASTVSGGTWTLVSGTFTVPAGATTAHVLQHGNFGSSTSINFKGTACDYELGSGGSGGGGGGGGGGSTSTMASERYGWGTADPDESDEYNGSAVDLSKWALFGNDPGQTDGCAEGFQGHGQRCGSQVREGGGYVSVTGTADGVTGGLSSRSNGFKYGRVEVRERAVPLSSSGKAYHAVPLLWPASQDEDYRNSEIDFAERDVADPDVELFVHHDSGDQEECSFTVDSTQFHNYAVDWEPSSVTWYVDGNQVCTVNVAIPYYDRTNGGAQLDMFPENGPMQPAREDVDWIHMFPSTATQYR